MKIIFFANTEWYLYNFRLGLARYLRDKGYEVIMMSPMGPYGEKLVQEGFRWYGLPMDRMSINIFTEMKLLWKIWKIYRSEKPDVVHNFTIKCVVYGSLMGRFAGVHSRINAVTGLGHVFIGGSLKASLLRPIVKLLLKMTLAGKQSRLILQNPDDKALFLKLGLVDENKIDLIKGSGVNTDLFLPVDHSVKKPFKVFLAARLLWEKGIREYIEVIKFLHEKRPGEFEFYLVGSSDSGNPSAVPQDDIDQWIREDLVIAPGHVDDIHTMMKEMDLVVLPSYREGVPRGLIEAAAMELPIITTDAPGCREIVADGVNGYLVPVRDWKVMANKMEYLLDNTDICEQLGKAGRQKVLDEFDEKIVFEKTFHVYEKVLG